MPARARDVDEDSSRGCPTRLRDRRASGAAEGDALLRQPGQARRGARGAVPDWEIELLEARTTRRRTARPTSTTRASRRGSAAPSARRTAGCSPTTPGSRSAALDGAPGVVTARWAEGRHVEKALAALDGRRRPPRAATSRSSSLLAPDGREFRGTGVLEGEIAEAPRDGRLRVRPGLRPTRRVEDGRGARRRLEGAALAPRARRAGPRHTSVTLPSLSRNRV